MHYVLILGFLGSGLASLADASTSPVMVYVHCAPESHADERQLFAWTVLREALERTRDRFGGYDIREAPVSLQQQRQIMAMGHLINIAYLPVLSPDQSRGAAPVRIPVMGGLWGYRVLLIRADSQSRFNAVRTLEDLRGMAIGQAWFWPDTVILRNAGLSVVTGDSYEGLFKMLANGRFDAFSRGITEILPEYQARQKSLPALTIDRHLLLHYPMPDYFWFPDDSSGLRLAARVQEGLQSMVADRSLCRMVEDAFGADFRALSLDRRTVIDTPNSLLGKDDHLDDPAYWCSPSG